MRKLFLIVAFSGLLPLSTSGQSALPDTRPFGKYLVRICTWESDGTNLRCDAPAHAPVATQKATQSIEFKQVASGDPVPSGDVVYPLQIGAVFFVSAKSTSGLPVTITPAAGSLVEVAGTLPEGRHQLRVTGPGTIVLKAEQAGNGYYQRALPVTLVFEVGTDSPSSCKGLLPVSPGARSVQMLDASGIVGMLGSPLPYVLSAQGPKTILIYTTRSVFQPVTEVNRISEKEIKSSVTERERKRTEESRFQDVSETQILDDLTAQIGLLLGRSTESLGLTTAKPFSVYLSIPHAGALGDVAARINGLNYKQFPAVNAGGDRIQISAPSQPDCAAWTAFLKDIRKSAWGITPESSSTRLYYVGQNNGANGATQTGASDVSTAFGALFAAPTGSAAPPAAPAAAPAAPASNATITVNQPAGSVLDVKSDTTPCVVAGLAMGNSGGCSPGGGTASAAGGGSSGGSAAPKPPGITMSPLESDMVLFSSSNPGDDAQITERKRVIAQLDLPRPEMIINGWVLQNSTTNSEASGAFTSAMKELVSHYNERFQNVVLTAWDHVRRRISANDFFDPVFYHYIADRYIGDTPPNVAASNAQDAAQQFLDSQPVSPTFPEGTSREDYGICATDRYCLGYTGIFQPIKPRLTDVLLALIAAKDTVSETLATVHKVEGSAPDNPIGASYCESLAPEDRGRCRALWTDLGLTHGTDLGTTCERDDLGLILWSAFSAPGDSMHPQARVYLRCFMEAAQRYLLSSGTGGAQISPSGAGLMRAAVANFLFHYKMSQQYPHEFEPYQLSQSADALNAALNPLIDAFNRDLATFQRFVRSEVRRRAEQINRDYDNRCCAKRLFGLDKPSFFNDGIITVRTVSGQPTYATSTSLSFLSNMAAPRLTDLLNSLTGTGGAAPAQAGTAPISALLPTKAGLGSAQLGAAFLNNFQTTYAQIGRQLAISAIPRSLATASSAEIVVSFNVDDQAGTGIYAGGPQNGAPANISRVSNSDTSTRVRVESVRLFEISSATTVLQRSRSRFPLLPPLVELPYIGTIAGIPLPPAKEFHQSTAFLSAVVVPTAADIAYGLEFQFDDITEADSDTCSVLRSANPASRCRLRRIVSPKDFGPRRSIAAFNRTMVQCLATDLRSGYPSLGGFTPAAGSACTSISFENVLR